MKKWILDYHSNKGAVESLLYLKGHDDTSKEMLIKARYASYIQCITSNFQITTDQTGRK